MVLVLAERTNKHKCDGGNRFDLLAVNELDGDGDRRPVWSQSAESILGGEEVDHELWGDHPVGSRLEVLGPESIEDHDVPDPLDDNGDEEEGEEEEEEEGNKVDDVEGVQLVRTRGGEGGGIGQEDLHRGRSRRGIGVGDVEMIQADRPKLVGGKDNEGGGAGPGRVVDEGEEGDAQRLGAVHLHHNVGGHVIPNIEGEVVVISLRNNNFDCFREGD